MKQLETTILINASKSIVWKVLTDFESYPEWNPFIRSISGTCKPGERITARIQPPGQNGLTFKPIVKFCIEEKEFRWEGHLLFRGLFDGEHVFKIKSLENDQVEFTQAEYFRGILVLLLSKSLVHTEKGFHLMNEALKKRCEKMNH